MTELREERAHNAVLRCGGGVGVGPRMGNIAGREDSGIREISTKGK